MENKITYSFNLTNQTHRHQKVILSGNSKKRNCFLVDKYRKHLSNLPSLIPFDAFNLKLQIKNQRFK